LRLGTVAAVLDEIARRQDGVFSRAQANVCGFTDEMIEANVAAGRWRRVLRGVYSLTTGALSRRATLWTVLLRLGAAAVLSHETAAELWGLDAPSPKIHVTMPSEARPSPIEGVVIHRSWRIVKARHPVRLPPLTTVEETVLDLTQTAPDLTTAAGWMARAVGARLTTADRLREAIERRPRMRWRRKLCILLREVADGCHSFLELLYRRDVESAHGLPRGTRQVQHKGSGRTRYRDVEYDEYGLVAELDGMLAHPDAFRDMDRDNAVVLDRATPLRYGFRQVYETPCRVALQVATVLAQRGWKGRPRRCKRSGCVFP
jgi:hypothetical protein